MAYVVGNPKTKKLLKEWIKSDKDVQVFQPGRFGGDLLNGSVALEGPQYPEAHRWYAEGTLKDGRLIKVK
jgi:hypothetical protein